MYYTPEIEEFHVGFECEGLITEHGFQGWSEIEIIDSKKLIELRLPWDRNPYDEVRVKHLDQEDIESLGWSKEKNNTYTIEKKEDGFNCYSKYTLTFTGRVNIQSEYFSSWGGNKENFSIRIKNKSELRKLMQQLGII